MNTTPLTIYSVTNFINNSDCSLLFNYFTKKYSIYIVGGCVRDIFLGNLPHDIDFCTNATVEQMKEVCTEMLKDNIDVEIIPTGEKFGTLTFHFKDNDTFFEVTTYRNEGRYLDNRHPSNITYSDNIYDDVKRRDFTINAIAMDSDTNFVDFFGGINDIRNKIIRCVGDPYERLSEDALRIFRMVRFAIKYNFTVDTETYNAAYNLMETVSSLSSERIGSELLKIFSCDVSSVKDERLIKLLLKILHHLFGDFNGTNLIKATSVYERFYCLFEEKSIAELKNTMDVYALGSDIVSTVLCVKKAVEEQSKIDTVAEKRMAMRHLCTEIEFKLFIKVMETKSCETVYKAFVKPLICDEPYKVSQLAINGDDVMKEFSVTGKQVGKMLKDALVLVCHSPQSNNKNNIINYLKEFICGLHTD